MSASGRRARGTGSTSKAATVLGVSPRKIQYKLHEYAGTKPQAGDDEE